MTAGNDALGEIADLGNLERFLARDHDRAQLMLTVSAPPGVMLSLLSVCHVLVASRDAFHAVGQLFPDMVDTNSGSLITEFFLERANLLFGEPIFRAADGALECVFQPSDWYLDVVAAIALCDEVARDFDLHGWPVLSVVRGTSTVAGAGGVSSVPGEGAA